jgi:integrase
LIELPSADTNIVDLATQARIRLYDLRHTYATLLLCRNVHPKYVQELFGHASIAQTLDTYSHVLPGMDGGIGDAIDEVLG